MSEKIHLVALLCSRIAKKYAYKTARRKFGEEGEWSSTKAVYPKT